MTEMIEAPSSTLPAGAQFHRIAFVASPTAGETVLADLPAAIGRRAVVVGTDPAATPSRGELLVLAVPATVDEDPDLLAEIRDWADPPTAGTERTGQLLTLQGAQVFWTPARLAVVASTTLTGSVVQRRHRANQQRNMVNKTVRQEVVDGPYSPLTISCE